MKAEHRKELETNTLADKMGQMMNRVQGGGNQRRALIIYVVLAIVIVVASAWGYRSWTLRRVNRANEWAMLYDGSSVLLQELALKEGENVGKAARLQFAWHSYWEGGVKMMGNDSRLSMKVLGDVAKIYRDLAKDCKDDPIFEPEVLLGLAVVEETKAIQDRSHLESATEMYEDLVTGKHKQYKDSAQGKFAQARLEHLKDTKKRAEVISLYAELQREFKVAGPGGLKLPGPKDKGPAFPIDHP